MARGTFALNPDADFFAAGKSVLHPKEIDHERPDQGQEVRVPPKRAAAPSRPRRRGSAPIRPDAELSTKDYEKALKKLHVELVKLQLWVQHTGAKVCIVFEGRDGAGKGGTIKAITERVSPRVFRVVALPAPTEREKSQMYVQRYLPHLPAAGEVVIFDRSWYNRAGVERVMGFCTDEQADGFLKIVPLVEKAIVESGVILLKYWLEVSPEEQTRRLKARIEDGRKIWKLSPMDLKSYNRWYDYSRARDDMFAGDRHRLGALVRRAARTTRRRARLNIISDILKQHSVQGAAAREAEAAEAAEARATTSSRTIPTRSSPRPTEPPWTPDHGLERGIAEPTSPCATGASCTCAPSRRPTRRSSCRPSSA